MGEFSLIHAFLQEFPRAGVPVGPGDDCAVLAPEPKALCVTTDAIVEEVHFTRAHFLPEDIGHKALAVNLSDLAAMGARPRWFLCALALPRDYPARELIRVARGMAALARAHRIHLVGGNLSAARELSLTLTAAGVLARPALTRSGAKAGDALYVSGTLGEARLGLLQLQQGKPQRSSAIQRQRRPLPRIRLGLLAARFASAGMDLSDGLGQDLGHLCEASGTGARVELERLPLSPAVRKALGPEGALQGGEDYELLLAVPPHRAAAFERACARAGEAVARVGVLTRERTQHVVDAQGRSLPPLQGYDHLRQGV